MVVGFSTLCVISVYHHKRCEFESCSGKVYLIQHYVIKIVSDLRQVVSFHNEMYLIQHYVIKSVSDLRQVSGFLHQ